MLYDQEDFNPTAERRKKGSRICTLIPVCAAQPSSTLSYSTHLYILGNKRKRKEADYIFYTSVLSSFSAIQQMYLYIYLKKKVAKYQ